MSRDTEYGVQVVNVSSNKKSSDTDDFWTEITLEPELKRPPASDARDLTKPPTYQTPNSTLITALLKFILMIATFSVLVFYLVTTSISAADNSDVQDSSSHLSTTKQSEPDMDMLQFYLTQLDILKSYPILLIGSATLAILLCFPVAPFTLAAGYYYGTLYGGFCGLISMVLGASLSYVITKNWLKNSMYNLLVKVFMVDLTEDDVNISPDLDDDTLLTMVEAGTSTVSSHDRARKRLDLIISALSENSLKFACLIRFSPMFPYGFTSYLLGLSQGPFGPMLVGSLLGVLPGCFLLSFQGSTARSVSTTVLHSLREATATTTTTAGMSGAAVINTAGWVTAPASATTMITSDVLQTLLKSAGLLVGMLVVYSSTKTVNKILETELNARENETRNYRA